MAVPTPPKAPEKSAVAKPDPMAAMAAAKERAKSTTSKRPRPQAFQLNEEGADPVALMLFGHIATGKTYFLIGLLLEGERIFVMSSDFGKNGLLTVKQALKKMGRLDLLKNILAVDVATYDDIIDALEDPLLYAPSLLEFDPTVFIWEGFSAFNVDILDEHILTMAPGADKSGELRHAGFTHTTQDWQGMKRGTLRALRKAIAFVLPNGKRVHVIITAHESKPETNDLTNETKVGPLIQGTGRNVAPAGFDVILNTFTESSKEDNEVRYKYRCVGTSKKYTVKNRGFELEGVMDADPQKVWRILTNKEPGK